MRKTKLPPNPALIFINGIMLSGKSTLSLDLKSMIEERRMSASQEYAYHGCIICDTGGESKKRLARNSGSPLNASIKRIRENGGLQPVLATASVLYDFFDDHLLQTKDIIMCGSPRSITEAELLAHFLKVICNSFEVQRHFFSVMLTISDEEFTNRLRMRSAIESRPDDLKMQSVQKRIETHKTNTIPAVDRLNFILQTPITQMIEVGSTQTTKYEVFNMIESVLF